MNGRDRLNAGALNLYTQEFLVKAYDKGNSESTIAFLQYLLAEYPQRRIALLWDGASYHRSQEVRTYLESVNQDLDQSAWTITRRALCAECSRTKPG